jgi:hypothetical protein
MDIFQRDLIDEQGRTILLRGVSLATSKLPNGLASHCPDSRAFYDHRHVSFLDRPLPLKEADSHFARLRECGFNCLRLVLPWESIEHQGPGLLDSEYMDYLRALLTRMAAFDLFCIIDIHRSCASSFLSTYRNA